MQVFRRRSPGIPARVARPAHPLRPWIGVVFIGGALGTLVRAGLSHALPTAAGEIPWTIFAINLVGAFILGALLQVLALAGPDRRWRRAVRLGVGTGVMGGFTTYSTFALDVVHLAQFGSAGWAAGYALGSVIGGIGAAGLGIWMAGAWGSLVFSIDEVGAVK